jgi:D-amino-acid dehydrogenase
MKIIIIGGGVIGLCCAHYLNKEGHKVVVIDKGDITSGCSFGNMGYISPSHFVPLATPGIISQGLKWMLSSSSPFYIKPRLNMDLVRWGLAFRKKANAKQLEKNIPHLNNLLQLSRSLMNGLTQEFDFEMIEQGCWMLYKNEKTGEHEKHLSDQANAFGLETLICNSAAVQSYEPETEVDIAGGILYKNDCYVEPAGFMRSLYNHLLRNGVEFYINTPVTGFEQANGQINTVITHIEQRIHADEIIIANGSWIPAVSKMLGIQMLMQPGKGYSFFYTGLKQNLHYPSILVDDRIATSPYDRMLRIGGTMELSGHSDNILPKRVKAIYQGFKKYYPAMNITPPDTNKAWFGYRPVTPDGMPYIGRHSQFNNLSYAGGHAMLGVSAAAGTGKLMADIVARRKPAIELSAFDPKRFG